MNLFGVDVELDASKRWLEAYLDGLAAEQGITTKEFCERLLLNAARAELQCRRAEDEALMRSRSVH
jgi:hypothetical protein